MLLEEFDRQTDAVINPDMVTEKIEDFLEVTISCFSQKLFNSVLDTFDAKKITDIHSAVGLNSVYEVEYKGKRFALFHSFVGEPLCVAQYEDLMAIGSKRLILLGNCGYPYVEGMTWTTDACYRETREKVNRRKEQGAICVEMECAGMQALCDFRGTDFFQFFYAGDNLDHSSWDPRSISGGSRLDDKTKIMFLAFELGLRIMPD